MGGCHDTFGVIKDAYHLLIDPTQRAEYDEMIGIQAAAHELHKKAEEAATEARNDPFPQRRHQRNVYNNSAHDHQQGKGVNDTSFKIFRKVLQPDSFVKYKPAPQDAKIRLSRFDARRPPENSPDVR
jgi:curved DNA-binding protein CbpA